MKETKEMKQIKDKREIDEKEIAKHIEKILELLGEDPKREGLKDTPQRVAKMYQEVFKGINYTNEEIARELGVTFDEGDIYGSSTKDMVVIKNIEMSSFCEHHMALMYNLKINIGYIPSGKVLGLSKFVRMCDLVCKRLQLQERIGSDLVEVITISSGSSDVVVQIEGEHSCMTYRGIKNHGSRTATITKRGRFHKDEKLLQEFYNLIK